MQVLHINTLTNYGGAARAMFRLHQAIGRNGHYSAILARSREVPEPGTYAFADALSRSGSKLSHVTERFSRYLDRWFGIPRIHRRTTRNLTAWPTFKTADVIHLHNLHGWYFDLTALPKITSQKPVVWTLHDMWAFTGHCAYSYGCKRWRTGCFDCPLLKKTSPILVEPQATVVDRTRANWRLKQHALRTSRITVVTPSRWLADQVMQSILHSAVEIQVIPYGLDLDVFRPRGRDFSRKALDIDPTLKVILFVADSLRNTRKGYVHLLDALKALDDKESFLLLTIGHAAEKNRLVDYRLRELGTVSDDTTLSLAFSAADVLVLPSLADNLPLVAMEALACGTPVVAYEVGGIPEMVRHMETGYLAHYGDPNDIARGIQTLVSNDQLRLQVARRCREMAAREYGSELQLQRYLILYEHARESHEK